jgi:glycolate oxidase
MFSTKPLNLLPNQLAELQRALDAIGDGTTLLTSDEARSEASHDETEDLYFWPDAVVEARSTRAVQALMQWATKHKTPVTPAGARTGLSGGALPVAGGIALSLRRMNAILEVDEKNHQIRVQPGVIVFDLKAAAAEKGLFYAVDPSSYGSCTIGGNIAENAGGPRAVKYGVTKDWVLNLEVVLADGTVIQTGADTLKNSTGYNLTQLMVGSEGTLGIVTEATLKLRPLPTHQALLLAGFPTVAQACQCVSAIFQAGIEPSALEFMERDAVLLAQAFTGDRSLVMAEGHAAHLLIEVDGFQSESLMPQIEALLPVLDAHGAGAPLFADDDASKERLWFLRRRVGEAVKAASTYKEEDTVVPRGHLPELLAAVKEIGDRCGFRSICYGHAGDGNLHVNILRDAMSDAAWHEELPKAIRELFTRVVALGGTISGEHGIGWVQRPYVDVAFTAPVLKLMKGVKNTFDPLGILNPGKIWPED